MYKFVPQIADLQESSSLEDLAETTYDTKRKDPQHETAGSVFVTRNVPVNTKSLLPPRDAEIDPLPGSASRETSAGQHATSYNNANHGKVESDQTSSGRASGVNHGLLATMNSVRGQPKVSSAEHAVEIDSFSTTQRRLSECTRYFPKRDHQLPSSDNIIPTKKARFSSGHPEAPGGDSVKLHSHQSTDLPGRDNTIKQPEMELKVAEGDMGFEIPTFVNNAPAIEVRCNRDTAHQEICAKTKKIYEK